MRFIQDGYGLPPFGGFHSYEMVFFASLEKGHAFSHQSIEQNDARLLGIALPGDVKSVNHRRQIIAIDALHMPAKRLPFVCHRFKRQYVMRVVVGLRIIDVDQSNQIRQTKMRSG
jgi:hypothetical protein